MMKHIRTFRGFSYLNEGKVSLIEQVPGKKITNPIHYSDSDLKKLVSELKKIKELDSVVFYEGVVEATVEDQTYMYGWSDDFWAGTFLFRNWMEANIPMSKEEFVAAVKDAVSYL